MLFVNYPKCSTCQKAKKYLDENKIEYIGRDIKLENPTYEELKEWYDKSGFELKKFFNTSGNIYKELKLKEKLPTMNEEAQLQLLATDGMLVKRPIVVLDSGVLIGFKKSEWDMALLNIEKEVVIDEDVLKEKLNNHKEEAKKIIEDEDSFERFIQRLEKKLKLMPVVGEPMAVLTCFVSLVRSYVKKDYKDIPLGVVIGIVSALVYFASPIDLIPDNIPILGLSDDIVVLLFVYKGVKSDVEEYKEWRIANGKQVIDDI